ncbi:MAG TPA: metallophosphoesterase [Hymenobacter sp.]|uniref:metallophosphoesterase n=1 Tax=Hymenobacter sp. TaxID=1898978 RepID=UPI002D7F6254|nr:metallophosphoesterase [Hymenobacter sp.]HET9505777.1 metallophosphoesterase [Hymenobacter sp.]
MKKIYALALRKLFSWSALRALALLLILSGGAPRAWGQHFAAIGDYGYAGPAERDVANLVKSWNPDFIITLGDNNYDVGDSTTIDQNIGQYYHEYIYNYKGRYGPKTFSDRFFPSLGNHDYYTRNGQAYRDYFTLPGNGRYYDFVRGSVHFFALNSDPAEPDGIGAASQQARWLQAALAASKARWKVVYLHHAPYSSGAHGSTAVTQWPFRAWGASLVLAGHDHHYERLQVDSLTYIVNGLGGRSTYTSSRPRLPQSQQYFTGQYGALLLDATPDSLSLRFFTRQRVLIDSYVLRQQLSTAPRLYPVVPNPLREAARVEFSLPTAAAVQVRVLNVLGQVVATLYQGTASRGWHQLHWARNGLPAGMYYVQLQGNGLSQVEKVQID